MTSKTDQVLVKVSGPDHTGVTSELMKCIMNSDAKVIDMGQSITHGLLSLSFLIEFDKDNNSKSSPLLKELLFVAKQLKMELEFEESNDVIQNQHSGDKYILNCVCLSGIEAGFLYEISSILADNNVNIQRIDNVTENEFKSLEIMATAKNNDIQWEKVKSSLLATSTKFKTDLALIKDNVWRRNKRLIIFDMDSTLIQSEVIVEMAKLHGVGDEVSHITERAMNGEIDFDESLKQRVSLLKGMPTNLMQDILKTIKLTDGVVDFVNTVKKLGYKVGIISGGFHYFADHFKEQLKLDYAFANNLEVSDGLLTGNLSGPIVNAEKKAMLVDMLAQQEGINLEQVVAIGDGANDLPMLARAGLGIAFHAKDIVKENAEQHMSHGPMTSILYFLGISGD